MKKLIQGALTAASSLAVILAVPLASSAASSTVVSYDSPNGWRFIDDQNDTEVGATGRYVTGPNTPPAGIGSAELETTTAADGQALLKNEFGGKKFSTLTTLNYSTYVQQGNNTIAPSLQFSVDKDVTDGNTAWQGRIVFEPYLNTSTDSGALTDGQWQTWNAVSGKWWLTKPGLFDNKCGQSTPCTLQELIDQFPNVGVNGGVNQQIVFKAGSGWTTTFIGNVDNLSVTFGSNSVTYDFEPYQVVSSTEQCKKDGYKNYRDSDGKMFKNQGQCVSWTQHNVNGNGTPATQNQ